MSRSKRKARKKRSITKNPWPYISVPILKKLGACKYWIKKFEFDFGSDHRLPVNKNIVMSLPLEWADGICWLACRLDRARMKRFFSARKSIYEELLRHTIDDAEELSSLRRGSLYRMAYARAEMAINRFSYMVAFVRVLKLK